MGQTNWKRQKGNETPDGNSGWIAGAVLFAIIAIMVIANADSDSFLARIATKALVAGIVGAVVGAIKGASKR